MSLTEGYADRVRAWAAELRDGSTRTWSEFLASGRTGPTPASASGTLPAAPQLELVRRLSAVPDLRGRPDFGALADLALTTAGPGRGLVDVPLPWRRDAAGPAAVGTPPVEPEALPAEEVLRVCTGVLVRLLAAEPPGQRPRATHAWRPWRRGFVLLGAPATAALVRESLRTRGLREGGSRATYLVLGGPLEEMMAQRWSARVRAGAALRWRRMWRLAATNDRLPPGIALPTIAGHLAEQVDAHLVHVVLGADTTDTLARVGEVLGVRLDPVTDAHDPLATDLLRRLNPVLNLAVGEERRRDVVERVWPEIAGAEESGPLGAPAAQLDWAIGAGERMAAALGGARYAVHGDPALVVPTRRTGVRRAPDPDDVLAHALHVVARAWLRRPAGTDAAEGQG